MNKKKLLALLMALVMTLTLVPVTALAEGNVAIIGNNEYATLQGAIAAANDGDTVKLLADVSITDVTAAGRIIINKSITLDMDGKKIAFAENAVCGDNFAVLWVQNDATLTLTGNGTIDGISAEAYGINVGLTQKSDRAESAGHVIIKNGTVKGDCSAIQIQYGDVTIEDGYFEANPYNDGKDPYRYTLNAIDAYYSAGKATYAVKGGSFFKFDPSDSASENPKGNFVADDYEAVKDGDVWKVQTSKVYVAQINDTKYETLQAAFNAAQDGDTVKLLDDVNATGAMYTGDTRFNLWINKSITLDGAGYTLTVKGRGIGVQGASDSIDVTIKNITVKNTGNANGRCVDTRGKLSSLTLDNATLTTAESSYTGYLQPLTIGGSQKEKATITITNSTIQTNNDGSKGYAITTFNPVNMTVTGGSIKGWACFNIKGPDSSEGSSGSTFSIDGTELTSVNMYPGYSNAYSLFKIEDDSVTGATVSMSNATLNVVAEENDQSIVDFQKVDLSKSNNCTVTINSGNTVNMSGAYAEEYGYLFASNAGEGSGLVITGGYFNVDPTDVLPEGYAAVKVTGGNHDGYYQVGKVEKTDLTPPEEEVTAETESVEFTVETQVKDETTEAELANVTDQKVSVSVAENDVANTNLTKVNLSNVVLAALDASGSDRTNVTSVEIGVEKLDPITVVNDSLTYEVFPVAYAYIDTEPVGIAAIDNVDISDGASFTFTLSVEGLEVNLGDMVKVTHESEGYDDEVKYYTVEGTNANKYITITTTHFSSWTVEQIPEGEEIASYVKDNTTYKTNNLQEAFNNVDDGETVTLLADISLTERLFVNAGATPAYAGANNRYATTSINKTITLDMNGHNIQSSSNIALAGGSLNIVNTSDPVAGGTISTSDSGLAPVEVRGTGDLSSKRTLTIGSGVILTGSEYGLNVFGSNDAQLNKIDVTVNGTVNGTLFVLGNLKNTGNEINININGTVKGGNDIGIAQNGFSKVTVNNGAKVSGKTGIEVRAGNLIIDGGEISGTGAYVAPVSNGSGTTSSGAAVAVAQHTTNLPINVRLNGGTLSATSGNSNFVVVADPENQGNIAGSGEAAVQVVATQSFTNSSNLPSGFKWVSGTSGYTLAEDNYVYLGASLRRRVRTDNTTEVVDFCTDMRFGYEVHKYDADAEYYFQWKVGDDDWKAPILIKNFADTDYATTKVASLVITNIPESAYKTTIRTKIYKVSNEQTVSESTGAGRSVKTVAQALIDHPDDYHLKWVNYAKFLLGLDNIQSYTLVYDEPLNPDVIIGHRINNGAKYDD